MHGDLPLFLARRLLLQRDDVVGGIAQGPQGVTIDLDRLIEAAPPARGLTSFCLHAGFCQHMLGRERVAYPHIGLPFDLVKGHQHLPLRGTHCFDRIDASY
jgi:hypothetical protein